MRAPSPPRIDGRLDDEVWKSAPVLDQFVQVMPQEGATESERTEIRLLYDDHALYVGIRCRDSQAASIRPRLGRRDAPPESDWVSIDIDSYHDRRTAYEFLVTAAGVQSDGILTEGQPQNNDWDGIWKSETHIDSDGWTAELAIPFSTLRFPHTSPQTWGFHVSRYISRLREIDVWNLIRMTDASQIGRYEELEGIEGARPGLSLQIIPYAAAQVRASFAQDSLAPRDPSRVQVGADLKYGVTGALTLDATVNPDFAQVEVDPEVVNLSAYETFFPEKRPFFLEGLDLFNLQGGALVYTRRIGAPPPPPNGVHGGTIVEVDPTARIVGAMKLTGNVRPGTGVGVLGAYVDETSAIERESGPLSQHWREQATPASWFQALRLRQVIGASSSIGVTETSVVRGHAEDPSSWQDAHVLALDWDVRGKSDYTVNGAVGRSFTKACDMSYSPSYFGHGICDPWGANLTFGKTGGEIQVIESLEYAGPEVDLNHMGFYPHLIGNQRVGQFLGASYNRQRPWRRIKQFYGGINYMTAWDPNAGSGPDPTPLINHRVIFWTNTRFANDWSLNVNYNHAFPFFDDSETRLNSRVRIYSRDGAENLFLLLQSNPSKPLSAGGGHYLNYDHRTESWQENAWLDGTLLLASRVQLGLHFGFTQWLGRPRWVTTGNSGLPLFGVLDLTEVETTLRATVAFTRDLTVQVFSQLLQSQQRYPHVLQLVDPRHFVPCDDAVTCSDAAAPGAYDADFTSLIVNAIGRWQFRPGSTMFLVYTHNHQISGGSLSALANSPADNVIAIKLSYLWAL